MDFLTFRFPSPTLATLIFEKASVTSLAEVTDAFFMLIKRACHDSTHRPDGFPLQDPRKNRRRRHGGGDAPSLRNQSLNREKKRCSRLISRSRCTTNDNVARPPTNVDFTVDLNTPAFAALNNNGGVVYNGGLIVVRTSTGAFIAVSQACTHAGATVQFDGTQFVCPAHGSIFRLDGSVARGPAGSPLARYNTSLNGHLLGVFS